MSKVECLANIRSGRQAIIKEMQEGKKLKRQLNDMGIHENSLIEVISNSGGPVVFKLEGSRMALGHTMAEKIIVEELD